MIKRFKTPVAFLASIFLLASCASGGDMSSPQKSPVDYVNPVSYTHLTLPTTERV